MTIKDLKTAIQELPDDMEVILQKDSEGNGYSPLEGVDSGCIYIPENTYSGNVYSESWSSDDADMDDQEWKNVKLKSRALVLFPVN